MANPKPNVIINSTINVSRNEPYAIQYTVKNQTEVITGAKAEIYILSNGDKLCTITNTNTPTFNENGFYFPIPILSSPSLPSGISVVWNTSGGYSVENWVRGQMYFIKISVNSSSGYSAFSEAQTFYTESGLPITFDTISTTTGSPLIKVTVNTTSANPVEQYYFDVAGEGYHSSSGWLYGSGTQASGGYYFTYTPYGLSSGVEYTVVFSCKSKLGTRNTDQQSFTTSFSWGLGGTITMEDKCQDGCVKLNISVTSKTGSQILTSQTVDIYRAEYNIAGIRVTSWIKIGKTNFITSFLPTSETFYDAWCQNGHTYKYKVVPFIKQNGFKATGNGFESVNSITPYKSVTVISEKIATTISETGYQFIGDVNIDSLTNNQEVGTLNPLGAKYPVVVKNSSLKYQTGSFSGIVNTNTFNDNFVLNEDKRVVLSELKDEIFAFLTNGRAKVITDWNGNGYVVRVTSNPSISFLNGSAMGLFSVSFEWTECGKLTNENIVVADE